MPNFAAVLKDEIVRLARKEVRKELEALKKLTAQQRSDNAELKRRVAFLEKQVGSAAKKVVKVTPPGAEDLDPNKLRFSAKRFAVQRKKLGVSAAEMGQLIGVSAQSVYHWEAGKSRPRKQQLQAIAALRSTPKRQVKAMLAQINPSATEATEA